MTRDEHAELISRLKASTKDEVLLRTIDIVATSPHPWVPAFNRVKDEVAACANCCKGTSTSRCQWAETDRRLNQVAWLALRSFDPVLLRDAALRTEQVLAPFFVTPPFYPDWDLVRPSNERFDGPAMANHFRWHPGTDFGVVFNLVWQLRGVMVLAAIGLLAILLPFF